MTFFLFKKILNLQMAKDELFKTIQKRNEFIENKLKQERLSKDDTDTIKLFYDKYYQPKEGEEKKFSDKIIRIEVEVNETGYYTKCLKFYFKDEARGKFIAKKFLNGSSHGTLKGKITNLMRNDIKDQINDFKLRTPKPNDNEEFEVDHYSVNFSDLRNDFIEKKLRKCLPDFFSSVDSYDSRVSQQWKDYHQDYIKNGGLKWSIKEENRNRMWMENKMRDDIDYQINDFKTKTSKPNNHENFEVSYNLTQIHELIIEFIEERLQKLC